MEADIRYVLQLRTIFTAKTNKIKSITILIWNYGQWAYLNWNANAQLNSSAWRIRNPPNTALCAFRSSGCEKIIFDMTASSIQTLPLGKNRALNVLFFKSIVRMNVLWISVCSKSLGSWWNSDSFCCCLRRRLRVSPPSKIFCSSALPGISGFTTAASWLVALRHAIKNSARVNLRHLPCKFCSSQTTTSTEVRPTQLTWPDKRISESCFGVKSVKLMRSTRAVTNVYGSGMLGSKFGIFTCWCSTHTVCNTNNNKKTVIKSIAKGLQTQTQ